MDFAKWFFLSECILTEVKKISVEESKNKKLFGPVYHGTTEVGRKEIEEKGFRIPIGVLGAEGMSHGYELDDYWGGIPAPTHHLGFGAYFTTVKNIAKQFNLGTARGLKSYYLDVPRLEIINFGAPRTMMKWWQQNGYDMEPVKDWSIGQVGMYQGIKVMGKRLPGEKTQEIEKRRLEATIRMTNLLKSKYDAVWYKGKGMRRLLDGDQVCVYDTDRIYEIDVQSYKGDDAGNGVFIKAEDRVVLGKTKATAVIKRMREVNPEHSDKLWHHVFGKYNYFLEIGSIKNPEDFQRTYEPVLRQLVPQVYADLIKERSKEIPDLKQNIDQLVNYYLDLRRGSMNLPSTIVSRVLQKGERYS